MKLDPDERLSAALKNEIVEATTHSETIAFTCRVRLFFMGRALPVRLRLTRLWRTGEASFSRVIVNEHAHVNGVIRQLANDIEHHDSPSLEHWLNKQNKYTTAEALAAFERRALAATPRVFGNSLERRMWLKRHYQKMPLRYTAMFLYHYLVLGAWRAGKVGWIWSHLRTEVYRLIAYKTDEMHRRRVPQLRSEIVQGQRDPRVPQYE
jgi:hypothetical protein